MNSLGLYILGACLLALIGTSSAIKCHQCATVGAERDCEDPFEAGTATSCEDRDHNVCRKITTIQYAVLSGDTEEVGRTVSRFCGGPKEANDCEVLWGDASKTYDCACTDDGCNASSSLLANISTVVMATVSVAMLKLFTTAL